MAKAPVKFYIKVQPVGGGAAAKDADARFVEATSERLQQVGQLIEHSCKTFVNKINALPFKPANVELEFGVTVAGKDGVPFITEGTQSGNFKISLKWDLQ